MPTGILEVGSQIVKENSNDSTANSVQEAIDRNDLLEGIRIILEYILSQKAKKNKGKTLLFERKIKYYQNAIFGLEEVQKLRNIVPKIFLIKSRPPPRIFAGEKSI